jgi:hypothetical protein
MIRNLVNLAVFIFQKNANVTKSVLEMLNENMKDIKLGNKQFLCTKRGIVKSVQIEI